MHCQHVDDDTQCRFDATRRVLVGCGDPPDPDQSGFAGTIYMVQVCKEPDPDPRRATPMARRFSLERALRNREHHTIAGLIAGFALLAAKIATGG